MADVYCALADRGAEITIVALTPYGTQPKRWTPYRGIVEERIVTSKAQQRSYGRVSKSLGIVVDDVLADMTPQLTPAYVKRLSECAAGADIVIASRPYLWSSIEHSWSGPLVYEAMDDEVRLMDAHLPKNEQGAALSRQVAELETRAVTRAQLTFAISDELAGALTARYPGQPEVLVVPPFVDPAGFSTVSIAERLERRRARFGDRPVILFVGSSHWPNVVAARALAGEAARAPEIEFLIAGNVAGELDRRSMPKNVRVLGIVPEGQLAALLALADLAVNPVRLSGGVNMKMLDYMRAAIPILSTTAGVTGLPRDVVATVFVSDDADWLRAICEVLGGSADERQERVTIAQRALAAHGGAIDALFDRLETLAQRYGCAGQSCKTVVPSDRV
jgi:glycosyltransferase involved in cell wall biosynthesis